MKTIKFELLHLCNNYFIFIAGRYGSIQIEKTAFLCYACGRKKADKISRKLEENVMARTNQGIFKKLNNEYKVIENEYEQVMKDYFSDGHWNGYGDFFSDFAYSADSVYCRANDLAYKIRGMMNATKFEEKDKKEKYEKMLSASQEIARDIKNVFDRTLELIKISGGGITDVEERTLDKLMIYR